MTQKLPLKNRINLAVGKAWIKTRMNINFWWLRYIKGPFRNAVGIWIFKMVYRIETWNKKFFDDNIKAMYIRVRQKEAFELKTKIVDSRKNGLHVKLLIMETPQRTMEIALSKQEFPDLYDTSKKGKLKKV